MDSNRSQVSMEQLFSQEAWAIRLARRLTHDEREAEELVQEAWVAALRNPPAEKRALRTWLARVLRNLALQHRREEESRGRHEREAEFGPEAPDTADVATWEETRRQLARLVLALGEPYRTTILLHFYGAQSSAEIARRLGVPAGTVRWRLKTGLDLLRAELDKTSNGDRDRWMSPLAALLGREGMLENGAASPPTASLASVHGRAAWVGMGAALLCLGTLAIWMLIPGQPLEARTAVVSAANPDEASFERVVSSDRASGTAEAARVAVPVATQSPLEEAQPRAHVLEVVVVDPEGLPVPDAEVRVAERQVFRRRALTDSRGEATIEIHPEDVGALGIPATRDRVSLRAFAEGYAASEVKHVQPGERKGPLRLKLLGPESVLRGRVIDEDGNPIDGAFLSAGLVDLYRAPVAGRGDLSTPFPLTARSAQDGSFELRGLSHEQQRVYVSARGFEVQWFEIAADRVLEAALRRGCSVGGSARRSDGTPAARARVWFEPSARETEWSTGLEGFGAELRGFTWVAETDSHGSYQLDGIPAGQRLWAQDAADPTLIDTIVLESNAGKFPTWDPVLHRESGGFLFQLVGEQEEPLPGWIALLKARSPEGTEPWIRRKAADLEGRVRIYDCIEDRVAALEVYDPSGLGTVRANQEVRPDSQEQRIRIGRLARVRATFLEAGGRRFEGTVWIWNLRTGNGAPFSIDAGSVRFEQELAAGEYLLALEKDHSAWSPGKFTLTPGEVHDFGTIQTPEMGTLHLEGSLPENARASYQLGVILSGCPQRYRLGRGPLPLETTFPAFPGEHVLQLYDGRNRLVEEGSVQVQSSANAEIVLGAGAR